MGSTSNQREKTSQAPEEVHTVDHLVKVAQTNAEVLEQYRRYADKYDQEFNDSCYRGPCIMLESVLRMFPEDGPIPRHQLRIMDIAAGTGLAGQKLFDAGIRHLDALDPSEEMLQIAKSRGIYQRLVQDTIGDHRIDVEDNVYDAVVIAGGFSHGHCPVTAFDEMLRICKPGGYVINVMRFESLVTVPECHGMENHMDGLIKSGKWRRIDRFITDRYLFETKQGITHIFQKL